MTGRGRGKLGGNRHRSANQRPMEHRAMGGAHRKNDGCLSAALTIVGTGAAIAVGAVWGVIEAVRVVL